jgi:uncharacterized heparinase superfamily protein
MITHSEKSQRVNVFLRFLSMIRLYLQTIQYLKVRQIIYRFFSKPRLLLAALFKLDLHGSNYRTVPITKFIVSSNANFEELFGVPKSKSCYISLLWNSPNAGKLSLYKKNGFEYLLARDWRTCKEFSAGLVQHWIRSHSSVLLNDPVWNPYVISLRLVNWIKWASLSDYRDPTFLESIEYQANVLSRNLEYHILGNHLVKNIKALFFAGHFLGHQERTFPKLIRLLKGELDEQILSDGGHFELSPGYHTIVLEDLLDIYNVLSSADQKWDEFLLVLRDRIRLMLEWISRMSIGASCYPHFNDSSKDFSVDLRHLMGYAKRIGVGVPKLQKNRLTLLAASGYGIVETKRCKLILDYGKIAPDYLPAHAHSDLFSFEMAVNGNRVLVNSGTDDYGNFHTRSYVRSAQAHNTATVDGYDHAELWGQFRMARRPKQIQAAWSQQFSWIQFIGSHDGFRQQGISVSHTRKVRFSISKLALHVEDSFEGIGYQRTRSFLHFHPMVNTSIHGNSLFFRDSRSNVSGFVLWPEYLSATMKELPYFENMGKPQPHAVLVLSVAGDLPHQISYRVHFSK